MHNKWNFPVFNSLSTQIKGLIVMVIGIILLLHTLGIIERGISAILILVSAGLITYGFLLTGYYKIFIKDSNNKPHGH